MHGIVWVLGKQIALQATGGVEHEQVQVTAPGSQGGEELLKVGLAGDVKGEGEGTSAQLCCGRFELLGGRRPVVGGDKDVIPVVGPGMGGGRGDASRGGGA